MSNFRRNVKNKKTGEIKRADFIDNYFGKYIYGVRVEGESTILSLEEFTKKYDKNGEKMGNKKSVKNGSKEKYVCIRADRSGVFCGYLKSESDDGKLVVLREARRIWYWEGANSLSELAVEGVIFPKRCKFPCPIDLIKITDVIEIIPMTDRAKESIRNVPIWSVKND